MQHLQRAATVDRAVNRLVRHVQRALNVDDDDGDNDYVSIFTDSIFVCVFCVQVTSSEVLNALLKFLKSFVCQR